MRRRTIFRTVSFGLTAVLLSATVPASGDTAAEAAWTRYDSAHFTFVSARSEAFTRRVAADLESLRAMLVGLFPTGSYDEPVPTRFFLFAADAEVEPYRLLQSSSPGFFQPTPLANFAALLDGDGDVALAIIQRQYLMALIRLNLPRAPAWLRHGLAAYYGTFERDEDGTRFGLPIADHLRWVREVGPAFWLPSSELIAFDEPPMSGQEGAAFQAQAWLLVHYLITESEERRRATARFVALIDVGVPPAEAFRQAIMDDLEALDRSLKTYGTATTFSFLRTARDHGTAESLRQIPLSPAAAHAYLGELVTATQPKRASLAAHHFRTALAFDPEEARAHAGLGALAERAGDTARARAYLARAAELAPGDARVAFRFASSLLDSLGGRRPAADDADGQAQLRQAISALRRSVDLEPVFAEAWARLGFALGLAPEPGDEAVEALETAAALLPGRTDIAFNLLLAYAHAGRRSDVEHTIARLEALGADEATLARARETRVRTLYREAVTAIRATELDTALPLLADVLAETTDPALRAGVEALVPRLLPVAQHNTFAKRFLEILDLYREGRIDETRDALDAFVGELTTDRQREAVAALRAAIERDPLARDPLAREGS